MRAIWECMRQSVYVRVCLHLCLTLGGTASTMVLLCYWTPLILCFSCFPSWRLNYEGKLKTPTRCSPLSSQSLACQQEDKRVQTPLSDWSNFLFRVVAKDIRWEEQDLAKPATRQLTVLLSTSPCYCFCFCH